MPFRNQQAGKVLAYCGQGPPHLPPMNKALAHRPRRSSQSPVGATKKSPSRPVSPAVPFRSRRSTTGHNVRYVLGFGLIAVIIAFVIVYLVYFHG